MQHIAHHILHALFLGRRKRAVAALVRHHPAARRNGACHDGVDDPQRESTQLEWKSHRGDGAAEESQGGGDQSVAQALESVALEAVIGDSGEGLGEKAKGEETTHE